MFLYQPAHQTVLSLKFWKAAYVKWNQEDDDLYKSYTILVFADIPLGRTYFFRCGVVGGAKMIPKWHFPQNWQNWPSVHFNQAWPSKHVPGAAQVSGKSRNGCNRWRRTLSKAEYILTLFWPQCASCGLNFKYFLESQGEIIPWL